MAQATINNSCRNLIAYDTNLAHKSYKLDQIR